MAEEDRDAQLAAMRKAVGEMLPSTTFEEAMEMMETLLRMRRAPVPPASTNDLSKMVWHSEPAASPVKSKPRRGDDRGRWRVNRKLFYAVTNEIGPEDGVVIGREMKKRGERNLPDDENYMAVVLRYKASQQPKVYYTLPDKKIGIRKPTVPPPNGGQGDPKEVQ